MPRRHWLLMLLALAPLQAPLAGNERCADRCRELGECLAQQGDTCVAVFDEDCQKSEACQRYGRCSVRSGVCVAAADPGCEASEMCRVRGECTAVEGHCEAVSDASCQQSEGCRDEGRCTLDDQQCVVGAAADCASARVCATLGACGIRNGTCAPTLDRHCAESALCADDGRCALLDGACAVPPATEDTGVSEPADKERPFELDGALKRNGVRPLLREVRAEAVGCGPLTADVELSATIRADGKVDGIAVLGVPRKQERCIAKALRKRRFPERKRPTTLTWRLHRPDESDP